MLDTLKLVRGAVSSNDLIPVLTHFRIQGGKIEGGDGRVSITAAIPELAELDCIVPAVRFLKAVDACGGEPQLLQKDSKLTVKRGAFKAVVPLLAAEDYPNSPSADPHALLPVVGELLPFLKRLAPFVSTDASRPWSMGVLMVDGKAYATNNVVLACVPCPRLQRGQAMSLPSHGIDELLRIGREPLRMAEDSTRIYFDYGNAQLSILKNAGDWPATLPNVLAQIRTEGLPLLPEGLAEAVDRLVPFVADVKRPLILLGPDGVRTSDGDQWAEMATGSFAPSVFRYESLRAVLGAASAMDTSCYPSPVPWVGDGIAGVIVGVTP